MTGFGKKKRTRGPEPQTNVDRFKKKSIGHLRLFEKHFFCFHTLGVRRTVDVLDSENQPGSGKIRTGSGALGFTGYTKSIKTKR